MNLKNILIIIILINMSASYGQENRPPVDLVVNGNSIDDSIVSLYVGENVSIGLVIQPGVSVQGIKVFSSNLRLQQYLTEELDQFHNKSDHIRMEKYEVNIPPLKDPEISFNIIFETIEGRRGAIKKSAKFVYREPEKEVPVQIIDEDIQVEEKPKIDDSIVENWEDIRIFVDGKEEPEKVTLTQGQTLNLIFKIKEGVLIKRVKIDSKSEMVKHILEQYLPKRKRAMTNEEFIHRVKIPEKLLKGNFPVTYTIQYVDKNFNEKEHKYNLVFNVPEGSRMLGILMNRADASAINSVMKRRLERIPKEITFDDITAEDLEKLGIRKENFFEMLKNNRNLPEIHRKKQEEETLDFDNMMEKRKDTFKQLKKMKEKKKVEISKNVYEIKYGERSIVKSKIIMSVPSDKNTGEGAVIVEIPKEIAETTDEMIWAREVPEILEEDPVIKWAFKNIPQNEVKDYAFTVDKDVQNFEILAAGAAENPGLLSKLFAWIAGMFT